jgi:hypothetical protein
MSGMANHARSRKLTLKKWQAVTVAAIVAVIAIALAVYAAAASYESVSRLAASRHVPLASLNPLGIDGGLFGVIVFDIALTWIHRPVTALRMAARLFAVGTIAANAAAGWPDPAGVGLRVAAPVLFVIIIESARTVLLNRDRTDEGRIPAVRWLLAPWPTWKLWRRMKLWSDSRLPRQAVDAELAVIRLAARYGEDWEAKAPADLVWMIRAGVQTDKVLERVAELTKPEPEVPSGTGTRKRPRKRAGTAARNRRPANAGTSARGDAPDMDAEARILALIAEGHSASKAGILAGKSDSYGRQVARLARTAPQDIVDGQGDGD